MGFNNPDWTWQELEAALSDRDSAGTDPWERGDPRARHRGTGLGGAQRARDGRAPGSPSWNAGGDGPAWSRKRQPFEAPDDVRAAAVERRPTVSYAELHCHSNFSFLDGASHPEELVTEAVRLGLDALALTDHNGFYGIVRFAEAARELGMPTIFGTELTLLDASGKFRTEAETLTQVKTGQVPDATEPDPHGRHLLLLADGPTGYARLARAIRLRSP